MHDFRGHSSVHNRENPHPMSAGGKKTLNPLRKLKGKGRPSQFLAVGTEAQARPASWMRSSGPGLLQERGHKRRTVAHVLTERTLGRPAAARSRGATRPALS